MFRIAIYALSAAFIVGNILKYWSKLADLHLRIGIGYAVLAVVCMAVSFFWLASLWHWLMKHFVGSVSYLDSFYLYMKSAVLRYIPGNVVGLAARVFMAVGLGATKTTAVVMLVLESAFLVATSIGVYFVSRAAHLVSPVFNVCLAVIVAFVLVLVFFPSVFWRLIRSVRPDIGEPVGVPRAFVVRMLVGYVGYWLLNGLGTLLLVKAVAPEYAVSFVTATGMFAVSWVLGFMSIVSPSGLGVREAALIYFFTAVCSGPVAIVVSIGSRLAFMLGEIVCYGGALLMYRKVAARRALVDDGGGRISR